MSTRALRIANIVLWGGAGLMILGIAFSYPAFAPYIETLFFTPDISAAPAITAIAPAGTSEPAFLPFEGEEAPSLLEVAGGEAPATPTAVPIVENDVTPTPTTVWTGVAPVRLRIPSIKLEAPIVSIGWKTVEVNGVNQAMWDVPNWRAAGWHETSAKLGVPGNTVLNGHNTSKGEVFRDLYKVKVGALILVEAEDGATYGYKVGEKYILPEAGQPLEMRMQNAQYILPTTDERLTMVTCHPYGSLTNRLLVIAYPAPKPEDIPTGGE